MTGKAKRASVAIAIACGALIAGAACAQQALLGGPAPSDGIVDKVVRIDAKTRWVNVTQDDAVRFIVSGSGMEKTFAWRFETSQHTVRLNDIAPAGTIDRVILVYLTANPLRGCTQ